MAKFNKISIFVFLALLVAAKAEIDTGEALVRINDSNEFQTLSHEFPHVKTP